MHASLLKLILNAVAYKLLILHFWQIPVGSPLQQLKTKERFWQSQFLIKLRD